MLELPIDRVVLTRVVDEEHSDHGEATKRVERPLTYGIFTDDNLAGAAPGSARRTAVLIAHGMGQQSKFDTLDQVAEGLDPLDAINKVARNVRIGDQSLSRIEMADFQVEHQRGEVHLYEAYWAPLTEGVIKLSEVIAFLKNAAWNGIANARRPFKRWLFNGYQQPSGGPPGPRTAIYLVLALAVLGLELMPAAGAQRALEPAELVVAHAERERRRCLEADADLLRHVSAPPGAGRSR